VVPRLSVIGVLLNPNSVSAEVQSGIVLDAAHNMGQQVRILHASSERDLRLPSLPSSKRESTQSLSAPIRSSVASAINSIALAARHRIPTIYEWREFVQAGGLI